MSKSRLAEKDTAKRHGLRAAFARVSRRLSLGLAAASVAISAPAAAAGPTAAAIVIDADSDRTLYENNANTRVFPASTTKLMTAYLTFEAISQNRIKREQMLNVSARAAGQPATNLSMMGATSTRYVARYVKNKKGKRVPVYATRTSYFQRTKTISTDSALRGLMVHSGNDTAVVLAEAVGGSVPAFAARMNAKAKQLGMTGSHFVNPNGLPDAAQRTTARDMAKLLDAMHRDFPLLYNEYLAVRNFSFNGQHWSNTNKLLDSAICPGVNGGKTGYIRASGFNMVISAERNGRRTIIGVFGGVSGKARNDLACNLVNYAYTRLIAEPNALFDAKRTYGVVMPPPRPVSPLIVKPAPQAPVVQWPNPLPPIDSALPQPPLPPGIFGPQDGTQQGTLAPTLAKPLAP